MGIAPEHGNNVVLLTIDNYLYTGLRCQQPIFDAEQYACHGCHWPLEIWWLPACMVTTFDLMIAIMINVR